jgi:hypothetical protein
LLVWLPEGVKLPKPDQAGWWTHGMSRIERARNAVGYLVKYASKCDSSGEFPKGARLFGVGVSGAMQETRQERTGNHRAGLPRWLRESTTGRCSRRVGGVWIERESGREFASPFQVRCSRDAWGVWTVFIEPRGES